MKELERMSFSSSRGGPKSTFCGQEPAGVISMIPSSRQKNTGPPLVQPAAPQPWIVPVAQQPACRPAVSQYGADPLYPQQLLAAASAVQNQNAAERVQLAGVGRVRGVGVAETSDAGREARLPTSVMASGHKVCD